MPRHRKLRPGTIRRREEIYAAKLRVEDLIRHGRVAEMRYKLAPGEYVERLKRQQNCCLVCNRHESEFKVKLGVDHCHKTGKIRGLLCANCNLAIGNAKESPRILRLLALYLEFHALKE